jgi:hypothetical protein
MPGTYNPATGQYTTAMDDTYDAISFFLFGSEFYVDLLIDANPEYYLVMSFEPGYVLNVPAVTPPVTGGYPPWVLATG